jgi:thioredoxin 1
MEFTFTDENFDSEINNSDIPVMVDFYADWCGPCKMMAPVVEELAEEYAGKVKIGKLNVDSSPNTAQKFGIMSIPTVLFFKNKEKTTEFVGLKSKEDIKAILDSIL